MYMYVRKDESRLNQEAISSCYITIIDRAIVYNTERTRTPTLCSMTDPTRHPLPVIRISRRWEEASIRLLSRQGLRCLFHCSLSKLLLHRRHPPGRLPSLLSVIDEEHEGSG